MTEHLKKPIEEGYRWLVIAGNSAWFAKDGSQFINQNPGIVQPAIVDLKKAVDSFQVIAGDQTEFTAGQVAAYAGIGYGALDQLIRGGVLHASVRSGRGGRGKNGWRVFSRSDAFAATVIGALRRKGVKSPAAIGKVLLFLAGFDGPVRDTTADNQSPESAAVSAAARIPQDA
jgi:hypothetical protein